MAFSRALAFGAACLAVVANASPALETRQALAQVLTNCTKPNQVALTFDDGPWIYNGDIVDTLNAAGAKGTFFLNGNNYGCIYDENLSGLVKSAYDQGHQIGSHTWNHKDLATLTWDQIHDEMWRVEEAVSKITGAYVGMMRPPFGSYNDLVRQASAVRGQKVVIWDFDSGDSVGATVAQSKAAYDTAIGTHPWTILTLNHETIETTAHQVLPYAIQKLQAAGYKLVTVAECTGQAAYQYVGQPTPRDDTWHC